MRQQTVFPILSVQSEEQSKLARDLSIITNVLGYKVIEVELKDPRVRQLEGIMVCKYHEYQPVDEELLANNGQIDVASRYPNKIEGGTLHFVNNPYARIPLATGRVAFLIDDDEKVPFGSMSGCKTGWNREFLASHYDNGFWVIADQDIDKEIKARHKAILENQKTAGLSFPNDGNPLPVFAREDAGPVDDPAFAAPEKDVDAFSDEPQLDSMDTQIGLITAENASLKRQLDVLRAANAKPAPKKKGRQKKASVEEAFADSES